MAMMQLEIITAERVVYSDEVNAVVAPGIEGELGILPHHAALMTMLKPGELLVRKDSDESYLAVSGGFMEVLDNKVIILADAAERAEEIDAERAEAARHRAEELLKTRPPGIDIITAEAALRRSLIRLKVTVRRKRK